MMPIRSIHLLLCLVVTSAHAMPLADTEIINRASVSYVDAFTGLSSTVYSNEVKVIVQPLEALVLTPGQSVTRPVGLGFALPHRLSNTGNTPTVYALSYANPGGDDYDAANLALIRDLNGNGIADSGEPEIGNNGSITLNPGAWIDLVLTGLVPGATPPGKTARLQLAAVNQAQQVTATSMDSVITTNAASVQLVKTASNLAPNRGDEVTFTLTATNTGNATAADIEAVIAAVRSTVKEQTGIELVQEVRIIGEVK